MSEDISPQSPDIFVQSPESNQLPLISGHCSPIHNNLHAQDLNTKNDHLDKTVEERRNVALTNMKNDHRNGIHDFGQYMRLKKDKLNYQVNVLSKPSEIVSDIFSGVAIFVNGHTVPTALELRTLIQIHGGRYHCYQESDTTHIIATSLAATKVNQLRKNDLIVQPKWIVESIAAGCRLPENKYLLLESKPGEQSVTAFFGRTDQIEQEPSTTNGLAIDARDPNFLQQFYARSRLHLISTLAQDMKDFVNELKLNETIAEELLGLEHLRHNGSQRISDPVIFHIDLDCFFVSVALRTRQDLIGKPVAITHSRGSTNAPGFSEIASCSYSARSAGLRNGMLIKDALKLCPNLICLPYQFEEYRTVSRTIYTLIAKYTLNIKAVSCDEMYINFTDRCESLNITDVVALAEVLRKEVRAATGCPASVGIGPNCLIARLATKYAKPDGVHFVQSDSIDSYIQNQKIDDLPGVGHSTISKLRSVYGEIERCADIQQLSLSELEQSLGKKTGQMIYRIVRGEDNSLKTFSTTRVRKSVSCDVNYGIRFTEKDEVVRFLGTLAEEIEKKLATSRTLAGSIGLRLMIRSPEAPIETKKYLGHGQCDVVNRTSNISSPTASAEPLLIEILKLFDIISPVIVDLRGIGVHCNKLIPINRDAPITSNQKVTNFFGKLPVDQNELDEDVLSQQYDIPEDEVEDEEKEEIIVKDRDTIVEEDSDEFIIPSFRGSTTWDDVCCKIQPIILEKPNKHTVHEIWEYFVQLADNDQFIQLEAIRRWLFIFGRKKNLVEWNDIFNRMSYDLENCVYFSTGYQCEHSNAKVEKYRLRNKPA